ncbi:MAG: hypothetical protein DHS20C06_02800 [Hyphobacterium sp.]|nr:MAG: hypothetical protein DHS20C06_02800 [Hyphobacterium sp.]
MSEIQPSEPEPNPQDNIPEAQFKAYWKASVGAATTGIHPDYGREHTNTICQNTC